MDSSDCCLDGVVLLPDRMEVTTVLMLLLIAVMEFVGVVACPVEHECEGFGLEDPGTGTGEAAFCNGPQAAPYCPGVYILGTVIEDITSPPCTTTSDGHSAANTTAASVVSCQPAMCNGKPEGIYYHPDCDCRRYYTCLKASGNPAILTQNNYRCCDNYYIDADKHFCTEDIWACTTD